MLQHEKDFKEFYYKYFRIATFSAVKFTSKIQESEEIVDDCFLGLWAAWSRLNTEQERLKYLQRSVKNRCMNLLEKKEKIKISYNIDEIESRWSHAEIHAFFIDTAIENVKKHIEKLHPRRRQIMRMIVDGTSISDIASQLGIAEKTVHAVKNIYMPILIKLALR